MSIRLVSPAIVSLVLLANLSCGPEPSSNPQKTEGAPASSTGEVKRPLNMDDAVAVGFTKQQQTLYDKIAAEDGWQGTFDGILVQIYVFPEIVPGYVPTSFFADAVKKEATWRAHRIVRNVGILCGTEGACAELEKELRRAAGASPRPEAQVAQNTAGETTSRPGPESQTATSSQEADERQAPQESTSGAEAESQPSESQPTDDAPSRPTDEATSQPGPAEAEPVAPEPDTPATPARPSGTPLPYSVAIASFSSLEDAMAKQRELAGGGLTLFVAPVVVKGKRYYRLLAGALADRDAARALQQSLVQKRIKREATAWDIRPANLAFHMGTYANGEEAESAIQRLLDRKIPAYAIVGSDGVYVYAGGYESEADAALLGEGIREAGLEAGLVERRGEAR